MDSYACVITRELEDIITQLSFLQGENTSHAFLSKKTRTSTLNLVNLLETNVSQLKLRAIPREKVQ